MTLIAFVNFNSGGKTGRRLAEVMQREDPAVIWYPVGNKARNAARRLPQVEVTIAGDGSARASLEESARDVPNVRFAGFQQNLDEFYERSDIYVMPSLGPEGLPIASLEAMAHGLPCIFSDLPVHDEITDGGKHLMQAPAAGRAVTHENCADRWALVDDA